MSSLGQPATPGLDSQDGAHAVCHDRGLGGLTPSPCAEGSCPVLTGGLLPGPYLSSQQSVGCVGCSGQGAAPPSVLEETKSSCVGLAQLAVHSLIEACFGDDSPSVSKR